MYLPQSLYRDTILTYDSPITILQKISKQWNTVAKLSFLALQIIAQNFANRIIFRELSKQDREYLQELLNIELDLQLAVPYIELESYWKRRFQAHFNLPTNSHLGWTWKCLYLEHYLTQKIENYDHNTINLLSCCCSYIHNFSITKLHLFPILKHLRFLTQLQINCDKIDCEKIGQAIQNMKQLKILRLNINKIENIQVLLKKLVKNLVELDLSHCKIGDTGANYIGIFLNVHEGLKVLKLRDNKIGPNGIFSIAYGLRMPQGAHLQHLDLSQNPLGKNGCNNLMHTFLPRELNISKCCFEENTSMYIALMFTTNKTIKKLDISQNIIGIEGGKELLDALSDNYQLQELNITETGIPDEIQQKIKAVLERNVSKNFPGLFSLINS